MAKYNERNKNDGFLWDRLLGEAQKGASEVSVILFVDSCGHWTNLFTFQNFH